MFIIPLYQRKYTWKEDNCNRLFDDIVSAYKAERPSHFFGSIVIRQRALEDKDQLVIDGQQRLTTISLFVMALTDVAQARLITCHRPDKISSLRESYLYTGSDKWGNPTKLKLRPIEEDDNAYKALLQGDEQSFVKDSKMTINYLAFRKRIIELGLSFEELTLCLNELELVVISLGDQDDPQLIFESLNSTGVDLSEADKVRNYLLMSLQQQAQDDCYNNYWHKIEKCTDDEPTMFIRDYLTVKLHRICNIDVLYDEFKKYDQREHQDRETLLADMLKFARLYEQITKGTFQVEKVDRRLKQLAALGSNVHLPFLLSCFDYEKEKNDYDDIYKVLNVVEGYWARRIVCGYPANALAKVFATLHYEIKKIIDLHEQRNEPLNVPYSEVLKYVLLRKQGNAEFPKDESTIVGFKERQIYKLIPSQRDFLFERMENEDSPEGKRDIVGELHNGERPISIEHIMPQTLTEEWKEMLGENYESIYNRYIHTFANLTLTGWNQNYSNRSFGEKLNGYTDKKGNVVAGFKESGYRLSSYVKTVSEWTEKQLEERQGILLGKFMTLFPMITTTYLPLSKESEIVSLDDDDFEYRSRTILSYAFKGVKTDVATWKEMLIGVSKQVYQLYPAQMTALASKRYWYWDTETADRAKVAENVCVYTCCDNRTKKNILRYLFEKLSIPYSELELYIAPLSDKAVEEE